MGTIKRGLLGGFSGKIANVVGGSWKGIAYMRSLPLSVAQNRTDILVAQRDAFTGVVALAKILLISCIKPLWDRFAIRESGYNAFVRANIKCFSNKTFSEYSNFLLSQGKMPSTSPSSITLLISNKSLRANFAISPLLTNQRETDIVYAAAYIPAADLWSDNFVPATRIEQSVEISFSKNLSVGDELYVYLSFKRADGTIVSTGSATYFEVPA